MLRGERSVQSDLDGADFFAFCQKLIHRLFDGLTYGTHRDDYILCVRRSDIVERLIFTAGNRSQLVHVFFDHFRNRIIMKILRFSALEIDIRILSGTDLLRMIRAESLCSEFRDCLLIDQLLKHTVIDGFDLLNLVGCTEAVKEMNKRSGCLDRGKMCDSCQVHDFLYRRRRQHRETGLPGRHYVRVIAENAQCMC